MDESSATRNQYLAAICVNIISLSHGGFCGWTSASFIELLSPNSPLKAGPLDNYQLGWIGSLLCAGGALGTIFFSWCADKIGRKRSLLLIGLPALLGWWIIPFAQNSLHLCLARLLGGFGGGGIFSVIPLYITESSEDKSRGILGTFLIVSCNTGILLAFILGNFFTYSAVAWTLSSLPLLFILCFAFLPESPQYLINQNYIKEAEKSLRYFRNVKYSKHSLPLPVQMEMDKLLDRAQSTESAPNEPHVGVKDLYNHKARKAFLIGVALMALNQFCGCFAMINYTASIFEQSGSSLSPKISAIIVGVIQLLGSCASTLLVERAGRKLLLVISSIGTGIGLGCLGGYIYLNAIGYDTQPFAWIPIASFSFTIFIGCCGVLTLPFVLVSEIMPPKIRSSGSMLCTLCMWTFAFVLIKYLPLMSAIMGMHGMMFFFASCSLSGALFVIGFVPETKGKSIETILEKL
uniref:Major facilitator superfamily (MFS) profile domain-containing protein n=1 Tax=Glossina palpalis gambiensis TaxID=67801 RepID=A0A1B0BCA7_9MUSC